MNKIEISKIVEKLQEIGSSTTSSFGRIGVSLNPNNFHYKWLIENSANTAFNESIKVDSIETAVEIVHQFSGNEKGTVREDLLKYSKFDDNKPLFLQFAKDLKY